MKSERWVAVLIGAALLGGTGYWGYERFVLPEIRLRNYQEMLRSFCAIRDATAAWKTAGGAAPADLAGLARFGRTITPDILSADLAPTSGSQPTPLGGYFFRLLRSTDPSSDALGVLAVPAGSPRTFRYLYLWTGSTHRMCWHSDRVPTAIPTDDELKRYWSSWCD